MHRGVEASDNTSNPPSHIAGFVRRQAKKTNCPIRTEHCLELAHHRGHDIPCMVIKHRKRASMHVNNGMIVGNENLEA
ncbi:unnamed protein product [Sphagnum jensenii]